MEKVNDAQKEKENMENINEFIIKQEAAWYIQRSENYWEMMQCLQL